MKRLLLTAAVLAGVGFGGASASAQDTAYSEMPAGVYELDNTHAQLIWRVMHAGLSNYTARFKDFDAQLTFDPANAEGSSLDVSVNPLSVETDYPNAEKKDFNMQLGSDAKWFNGGEFPKIEYKADTVEIGADNKGVIKGELTLLGVTKPLDLDVTFNGAYLKQPFTGKPAMGFSATGRLTRSDWGLDTYVPNIGDEVELIIEAEFQKSE